MTTTTRDRADELIRTIDSFAGRIRAESDENARLGHLNETTFKILEDANLVAAAIAPESNGGLGLAPYDALRVYERLSTVDTAAQWVSMVPGIMAMSLLKHLSPEVQKTVVGDGPPLLAGQHAPTGRAERVDGGYKITGRWSYGSAIRHCRYATGCAVLVENGERVVDAGGNPSMVIFFVPVEQVDFLENWDVIGLRATGSIDYGVTDCFVPADFTVTGIGGPPSADNIPGEAALTMMFHDAAALGAGRRVLDELKAFACKRSGRGVRLADDARFAFAFGKAEAVYRSARAFVYASWAEAQDSINAGEMLSMSTMTDIRASMLHLHDVNVENAMFAFREAGGTSLRAGAFQRSVTDIMAMGQHVLAQQSGYQDCARDYFGEADKQYWGIYGLVDY